MTRRLQLEPTVGELFAGLGHFGLGLAAGAGLRTAWQVESAPFPRRVLQARFPDAELLGDVREVQQPPRVGMLAGGFPCQDVSQAGLGRGLAGARSGLWSEFARIIGEVDPPLVLIENVPPLLYRGFEKVVYDLCALGYSVEWDCLPAAYFGAPHLRDRVWIVAHRRPDPYVFGQVAGLFPHPVTDPGEGGSARWPRAGFSTDPGEVLELQPLAPIGAVRNQRARALWPALARDFIPTICAQEAGNSVVTHLANKNGWDEATRTEITSLSVLARNGFRPATPEQIAEAHELAATAREGWPTPTSSAGGSSRRATARTDEWESKEGETLLDAVSEEEGIIWPTPTTQDAKNRGGPSQHERKTPPLNAAVQTFPTPVASDGERDTDYYPRGNPTLRGAAQGEEVESWPTPRASDGKRGADLKRGDRPDSGGDDLVTALERRLWPTPRASAEGGGGEFSTYGRTPSQQDGRHHGRYLQSEVCEDEAAVGRERGALNPDWVEWLMGTCIGMSDPRVPTSELCFHPWESEPPGVPRITEDLELRRDRLTALGNSLVPQAPAWIAARATREED